MNASWLKTNLSICAIGSLVIFVSEYANVSTSNSRIKAQQGIRHMTSLASKSKLHKYELFPLREDVPPGCSHLRELLHEVRPRRASRRSLLLRAHPRPARGYHRWHPFMLSLLCVRPAHHTHHAAHHRAAGVVPHELRLATTYRLGHALPLRLALLRHAFPPPLQWEERLHERVWGGDTDNI